MKKIFIILVLSFSFCLNVNAAEYTPYTDWSEYTDKPVALSDLIEVRKEMRYNYYKLNKVLGPYGETTPEFPYTSTDDSTIECTDWTSEKPNDSDTYTIESDTFYHYKRAEPANKITFKFEGAGTYGKIILYLAKTNEEIKYTIDPASTENFLILNLDNYYEVEQIKYQIEDVDSHMEFLNITIDAFKDDIHTCNLIFGFNGTGTINRDFKDATSHNMYDYYSKTPLDLELINNYIGQEVRYKTCQTKYRTYTLEKEYYGSYTKDEIDDYIYKDENDYKEYYSYRQREYIVDANNENPNLDIVENQPSEEIKKEEVKETNIVDKEEIKQEEKLEVLGETISPVKNSYIKAPTSNTLTLDTSKDKTISKNFYFIIIFIIILILTMSKVYKHFKKRAKV